jgi:hypothetical protein
MYAAAMSAWCILYTNKELPELLFLYEIFQESYSQVFAPVEPYLENLKTTLYIRAQGLFECWVSGLFLPGVLTRFDHL